MVRVVIGIAMLALTCLAVGPALIRWHRAQCRLYLSFTINGNGASAATFPRGARYEMRVSGTGYQADCKIDLASPPKFPVEQQVVCSGDSLARVWRSWDLLAVELPRAPAELTVRITRDGKLLSEQRLEPKRANGQCSAVVTVPVR